MNSLSSTPGIAKEDYKQNNLSEPSPQESPAVEAGEDEEEDPDAIDETVSVILMCVQGSGWLGWSRFGWSLTVFSNR